MFLTIYGNTRESEKLFLDQSNNSTPFQRNQSDVFRIATNSVGAIRKIRLVCAVEMSFKLVGQVTGNCQLIGSDFWYLTSSLTVLQPITLILPHDPGNLCRTDKSLCLRVGFCLSLLQPSNLLNLFFFSIEHEGERKWYLERASLLIHIHINYI